ncbi:MAG: histidine kinase [Tolypothrix carrinoi HA7290-LM1]|nr:histidine kinase [Tolypothrix carrinoi HA7290-LM1]
MGHWASGIGHRKNLSLPIPNSQFSIPIAHCPMPHAPCPISTTSDHSE